MVGPADRVDQSTVLLTYGASHTEHVYLCVLLEGDSPFVRCWFKNGCWCVLG